LNCANDRITAAYPNLLHLKPDHVRVAASGPTLWTSTYGLEPVLCYRLLIEPSGWARALQSETHVNISGKTKLLDKVTL